VSLARQQEESAEMPTTREAEPEARLPQNLYCRSDTLVQFIYDRPPNFLDTHTLVIDSSEHAVEEDIVTCVVIIGGFWIGEYIY
jgi:hypothetical protein